MNIYMQKEEVRHFTYTMHMDHNFNLKLKLWES